MPFVNVESKECIEHVSDTKEEEGMEDNKGSYGASMHGSTLTALNVLITFVGIDMCEKFSIVLSSMYKNFSF